MKPRVVSLFCGAGGLDLGFHGLGFEIVFACDNDPAAVGCYSRNIGGHVRLINVSTPEFAQQIKNIQRCDVVLGGFPCQGFSKAGPKNESDPRNSLYSQMRLTISILRPKLFIAENVDGLSQNYGGRFLRAIRSDFERLGYNVEDRLLDAGAYGAPQFRRRIFLVGLHKRLEKAFEWPAPTHHVETRNGEFKTQTALPLLDYARRELPKLRPRRTLRDAIYDLRSIDATRVEDHFVVADWPPKWKYIFESIGPGQKLCNVRHAASSVYTWDIPAVFGETSAKEKTILEVIARHRRHKRYGTIPNGNPLAVDVIRGLGNLSDISHELKSLLRKGFLKEIGGKYDLKGAMFCSGMFKRPVWDEPCPTVLTNFYNPRYFVHPSEPRPFSLRECARIQGFPDSFVFSTSADKDDLIAGYRLVGNAVSPAVSYALAGSVRNFLESTRRDSNSISANHEFAKAKSVARGLAGGI